MNLKFRKPIFIICLFSFLTLACENEEFTLKECNNADLGWLDEIIEKAKTDKTGNYLGSIYFEQYQDQPVIFIDMAMGSGGVFGYWFYCDGNPVSFEDEMMPPMTMKNILYTNIEF